MSKANSVRWAKAAERRGPEADGGKICGNCKTWKPFAEYWKHTGGRFGLRPTCKACIKHDAAMWRRTAGGQLYSRRKQLGLYGLSAAQYLAMVKAQDGRCAICREVPPRCLMVDHDHVTGLVRGLLCGRCNTAIAYLQDNPKLMVTAGMYLATARGKARAAEIA